MNGLAATLSDIDRFLTGVHDWVLKSKEGLTRDQARRIFHRYSTPTQKETPLAEAEAGIAPAPPADRQSQQMNRILQYMEQTTQRLDLIENDIGYIKEKVDAILKRI